MNQQELGDDPGDSHFPALTISMRSQRTPCLFNISGPYAVGKDTMLNALLNRYGKRVYRVRAITTRPVTPEVDPYYTHLSTNDFHVRVSHGQWIVTHQLSGLVSYGTSIDEIHQAAKNGFTCINSIFASSEGAGRLREVFGDRLLSVGLLAGNGSLEEQLVVLKRRLLVRGRDPAPVIEARIRHQAEPLRYVLENPFVGTPDGNKHVFDKVLVNNDLGTTVDEILALFQSVLFKEEAL